MLLRKIICHSNAEIVDELHVLKQWHDVSEIESNQSINDRINQSNQIRSNRRKT